MTNKDEMRRASVRERFLRLDTATVADVLDSIGRFDQGLAPEFRSRNPYGTKVAGWAFTIQGRMESYNAPGDAKKLEACDQVSVDDVTVWSGGGEGVCYFGELIAAGMKTRGCRGAVMDGGIRDLRMINEFGFPVFSCYQTPIQSIGRWRVEVWQKPIRLRGATTQFVDIDPGDFIFGDDDGIVVVPAELVNEVLETSEALDGSQNEIRSDLLDGLSLQDALARYRHL